MTIESRSLADIARFEDPGFYLNEPYDVYRRLQDEAPIFWYEPRRTWVLTRHADIRAVSTRPTDFSSAHGLFLNDANKDSSAVDALFGAAGEQILFTDPSRHRELRRIVSPTFTPRGVAAMETAASRFSDYLLDGIEPGEPFDFVEQVAARLPTHVACEMLGFPHDDLDRIRYWSDLIEEAASTDLDDAGIAGLVSEFGALGDYLAGHIEDRRRSPGDDFISMLLAAQLDEERLSFANIMMFTQSVIAGGNDTTRAGLAGAVEALIRHPDQRALLDADRSLLPAAVDECLRWVSPTRGVLRTATRDTQVGGQAIKAGQHVYLLFEAGNRDSAVFEDPASFDVRRVGSGQQFAFGYGPHVCIAAPLVRMEMRVFLAAALDRFRSWEIVGTPRRTSSVVRSGWLELPVVFHT